jgi:DNA gyrase/topoisomerase IV subunit B
LIKRFEEYRLAQNALLSRKEISSLIKVNEDSGDNIRRRSVVSKLVECTSRKRDDTELFIVEGDSAMGPYLYVRDKATQAVLPIRGKILNTTYKDLKEVIQNKEICDIANSIGCGIGAQCDASKSRYERIIISADADPDGLQINCLVLAVFINLFPDMVKQGRVFVSLPPLYCWSTKKGYDWCDSVEDVPAGVKVERFKGLGSMNNDQLYHFLVNKDTRKVLQIEYPSDIDEFNKILGTSEGKGNLLKDLGIIIS